MCRSRRALTPVISHLLMAALAIVLAMTVTVFALGLVDSVDTTPPTASVETVYGSDGSLTLVHQSGDPIPAEHLSVRVGERTYPITSYSTAKRVTAGETIGPIYPGGNERVHLVWRNQERSVIITTTGAPPGTTLPTVERFDAGSLLSYGGDQDADAEATLSHGARRLTLTNNTWKRIPHTYEITESTVIAFDFRSSSEGEIHGIGFETDARISSERIVRLLGTQNWGRAYGNYSVGDGWVHYEIPIGALYDAGQRGQANALAFVNDIDGGPMPTDSQFRNVRVYEASSESTGSRLAITIDGTTTQEPLSAYGSQDADGTYSISADNDTVTLSANTWRYAAINRTITTDTVLSVEFNATREGEIHAIGLETDESATAERFIQLFGPQSWAPRASNDYSLGDGWVRYEIDLSSDLSLAGSRATHLVFVNDDDADGSGVSQFRNVTIDEE